MSGVSQAMCSSPARASLFSHVFNGDCRSPRCVHQFPFLFKEDWTMKSRILLAVTVGALLSYVAPPRVQGEEAEEHIALESVPEAARVAAAKAVDGIKFEEAEVEAVLVYELEGMADGKEVEIEVTSDGHVIATESEADDDGKDNDAKADAKESVDDAAEAAEAGDESEAEGEEEDELEIPLSAVPQSVLDAAKKAVAGFDAKEAEVEPVLIYALEGEAKGVEYEVEVTSEGELVEVEKQAE